MSEEPQELGANEWSTLTYYPKWSTLQLTWTDKTREMGDEGFRATLQLLAEQGLKIRPKYMIVDSTAFFHQPAAETMAWRDQQVVPLYNEAGVEKFAFLVTDKMPGTVEKGGSPAPDGPAKFPTAWFETTDRMYGWLTG